MLRKFKAKMREVIEPWAIFSVDIGVDPRRFRFLINMRRYVRDCAKFISMGGRISRFYFVLSDYDAHAGQASGHYFHQDLLVANLIFQASPIDHLDVGSRIDGFVAHVASFRKIHLMDVRSANINSHPNISYVTADLMDVNAIIPNKYDSISSLHALEHFGLGRYGEPISPIGYKLGLSNLIRMLKVNGTLYVSFPIGRKNTVNFNAYRVFAPCDIFDWCEEMELLKLRRFDYVDELGNLYTEADVFSLQIEFTYGLGIYTFTKDGIPGSL